LTGELDSSNQNNIKEEDKKAMCLWNEKGGLILALSCLITPDMPINNILAFYEGLN